MEPFKAIEEHIDKDETEEKEAEKKIDIKMEELKEKTKFKIIIINKILIIMKNNFRILKQK